MMNMNTINHQIHHCHYYYYHYSKDIQYDDSISTSAIKLKTAGVNNINYNARNTALFKEKKIKLAQKLNNTQTAKKIINKDKFHNNSSSNNDKENKIIITKKFIFSNNSTHEYEYDDRINYYTNILNLNDNNKHNHNNNNDDKIIKQENEPDKQIIINKKQIYNEHILSNATKNLNNNYLKQMKCFNFINNKRNNNSSKLTLQNLNINDYNELNNYLKLNSLLLIMIFILAIMFNGHNDYINNNLIKISDLIKFTVTCLFLIIIIANRSWFLSYIIDNFISFIYYIKFSKCLIRLFYKNKQEFKSLFLIYLLLPSSFINLSAKNSVLAADNDNLNKNTNNNDKNKDEILKSTQTIQNTKIQTSTITTTIDYITSKNNNDNYEINCETNDTDNENILFDYSMFTELNMYETILNLYRSCFEDKYSDLKSLEEIYIIENIKSEDLKEKEKEIKNLNFNDNNNNNKNKNKKNKDKKKQTNCYNKKKTIQKILFEILNNDKLFSYDVLNLINTVCTQSKSDIKETGIYN